MGWEGSADAPPTARIVALAPSMHSGERRVADTIAADLAATVERTAQDVADAAGVGRATVVRTAQTLGYDGYPQLRVAVAGELARSASAEAPVWDDTLLGTLRAALDRFATRISRTAAGLTEEALDAFVGAVEEADRLLVVAGGLSLPLGVDLVLRLNAAGRPAEQLPDPISQRIAARQLGEGSACLVVSGSGANEESLAVARAAARGGARVLAITSFARSPLTEAADAVLLVPPVDESFRDELLHTSRATLMLVIEVLVDAVVARRGEPGRVARAAALAELGAALGE